MAPVSQELEPPANPGWFTFKDPLIDILRLGARQALAQAVLVEVADILAKHKDLKIEDGRARIVRYGHLPYVR